MRRSARFGDVAPAVPYGPSSTSHRPSASNTVNSFLDPRGLDAVVSKLADVKWPYAATGGFAAQRFAPIAPARQAAIYVEDIGRTAERLRLRPADAGATCCSLSRTTRWCSIE